jgi:adenylate kinase family enzyme
LGEFIKNNWNNESLTDVSINMMQRTIASIPPNVPIIIDGHPRTPIAARSLGDISQERPLVVVEFTNCENESRGRHYLRNREAETGESVEIRWNTYVSSACEIRSILKGLGVYVSVDGSNSQSEIMLELKWAMDGARKATKRLIPTNLHPPINEVQPIEKACVIQYPIHYMNSPRQWKHFVGRQVVSLTMKNIGLLRRIPYAVSLKHDGERCLLITVGDTLYAMNRALNVWIVKRSDYINSISFTMLDAEYMVSDETYIIIDVVFCTSKSLEGISLLERMLVSETICLSLQDANNRFFNQSYHVVPNVSSIPKDPKSTKSIDGYVFTPLYMPYVEGTDTNLLKWKPSDQNTVDFMYTKGVLYAKDKTKMVPYEELKSQHMKPWVRDGMIIECVLNNALEWIPVRIRTDKSKPNPVPIVQDIVECVKNPVRWSELAFIALIGSK